MLRYTALLFILFLPVQCSSTIPVIPSVKDVKLDERANAKQLIRRGDHYYNRNPRVKKEIVTSIEFYKGVIKIKAKPEKLREAYWKIARSYAYLSKYNPSQKGHVKYAKLGFQFSKKSMKLYPKNSIGAEARYYFIINKGLYAKYNRIEAVTFIPSFKQDANIVAKQHPKLDNAGAYRFLGFLYYKTPDFILGDDKARYMEFFEKACQIAPLYPPNLFYYAAYLQQDKKRKKSMQYVKRLFRIKRMHEDYKGELKYWKKRAKKLL